MRYFPHKKKLSLLRHLQLYSFIFKHFRFQIQIHRPRCYERHAYKEQTSANFISSVEANLPTYIIQLFRRHSNQTISASLCFMIAHLIDLQCLENASLLFQLFLHNSRQRKQNKRGKRTEVVKFNVKFRRPGIDKETWNL